MKNINSKTKESVRDYWQTQSWFTNQLEEDFNVTFVLDPCADTESSKGIIHIDETMNGLTTDWDTYIKDMLCTDPIILNPAVFVNPPFSKMGEWIDKIIKESNKGITVYMLHPDTSDTGWFQKIEKHCLLQLIPRSRLNYIDPETGKPRNGVNFQSCVSVFNGTHIPQPSRIRFTLNKPVVKRKRKRK